MVAIFIAKAVGSSATIPTVANVTSLRALTNAELGTQPIFMRGYTGANDGGEFFAMADYTDSVTADDGSQVFVTTTGTRVRRIRTDRLSIAEFGPWNSSITDWSSRIESAAAYCATAGVSLYLPPLAGWYKFENTIDLPTGTSIIADSPLLDMRASGTIAKGVVIGSSIGANDGATSNAVIDISVVRNASLGWTEVTNGIGLEIVNYQASNIRIRRCYGYNVNVRLLSIGAGVSYNTVTLGTIHQGRHLLELKAVSHPTSLANGWVNQNLIIGGRFSNNSDWAVPGGVLPAQVVFVSGNSNAYNTNTFLKCSFEGGAGLYRNPICRMSGFSTSNLFTDCRDEGNTPAGGAIWEIESSASTSGNNFMELSYSDKHTVDPVTRISDASTSVAGDSVNTIEHLESLQGQGKVMESWCSQYLVNRLTHWHTDGRRSAPGVHWRQWSGNARSKGSVTTGITYNAEYIELPTNCNEGPAVRVTTTKNKRFTISADLVDGYTNGRFFVVCYDAAGAQITSGLTSVCRFAGGTYSGGNFGGAYYNGSNAPTDAEIIVGSTVDFVEVILSQYGTGGTLRIRSFSIRSKGPSPLVVRSWYSHDDGAKRFGIVSPANGATGPYEAGEIIYNAAPTVSTDAIGWRNTGGSGGNWHALTN